MKYLLSILTILLALNAGAQIQIGADFWRVTRLNNSDSVYLVQSINNPTGTQIQVDKATAKQLVGPIFNIFVGGLKSSINSRLINADNMDVYEKYYKALFPNDPNIRQMSDSIVAPTFADTIKPTAYKGRFKVAGDTTMKFRTFLNASGKLMLDFENGPSIRSTFTTSNVEVLFGTVNKPVPFLDSRVRAYLYRSDEDGFVFYQTSTLDGRRVTFKIPTLSNR